MTWTSPAPDPVEGELTGDERPMLENYLGWQRSTLLSICAGLTAEQLASQPLASTNLSLLGLVRHMSKVERIWFRIRAAGEPIEPFFDLELGEDYDFEELDPAQAPDAVEQFIVECRAAEAAVAALPFEHPVPGRDDVLSLRGIHLHMIGEYARHNGHADLIRQAIDGVTGR
jgi:uncharacterized damage-inducible protein DinB